MGATEIEEFISRKIGLNSKAIGSKIIYNAVEKRMNACNMENYSLYMDLIKADSDEFAALTEELIIPETWFFRNRESFVYLKEYIKDKWGPGYKKDPVKILSIPCSTGEEPYSIAMTLMDIGMNPSQIGIDAVDISSFVIKKALSGIFSKMSFRGKDLSFRSRYFTIKDKGYIISSRVKKFVRFSQGNLLEDFQYPVSSLYDIIFFRNLIIYFNDSAKKKAVRIISRLLKKDGILFLGHVEQGPFKESGFVPTGKPGVFACRKGLDSYGERKSKPHVKTIKKKISPHLTSSSVSKVASGTFAKPLDDPDPLKIKEPAAGFQEDGDDLKMARHFADQGDLDKAFDRCHRFLIRNPANTDAHFLKAMLYQAVGNETNAEKFLEKTIYLDPAHVEALEQLALIYEHKGDIKRARNMKQRAKRVMSRGVKA